MWFYALFLYLCAPTQYKSIRLIEHPLEKRIAYIQGVTHLEKVDAPTLSYLQTLFEKYPLLIFQKVENVSPAEFLHFTKQFDKDCDHAALNHPDDFQHQMLQPFDQFPDCKHVAPRGNAELTNYYNIKQLEVKPYEAFLNHYVWHTDMLGHEYKLPNVVTGFYMVESPLIGGDTDFISGESVYESLTANEQMAAENVLIEINRRKFVMNESRTDYAGISRLEEYEELSFGNTHLPLVYAPETAQEKPRILLMPSFFERVVGWSVKESRAWIRHFFKTKVLPHRVSIQWKQGDLAVFNNRRFIHSSTPARNYLDNGESDRRLLLQTFIPTNRPLLGIKPLTNRSYSCYNVKWIKDQERSIISAHHCIKFAMTHSLKHNGTGLTDSRYYVLAKKANGGGMDI